MTRKKFLSALRQTPRDWYLADGVRIRRKPGSRNYPQCPISSLRNMAAVDWTEASKRVGLDYNLASNVTHAADTLSRKTWLLRWQIKRACGL